MVDEVGDDEGGEDDQGAVGVVGIAFGEAVHEGMIGETVPGGKPADPHFGEGAGPGNDEEAEG